MNAKTVAPKGAEDTHALIHRLQRSSDTAMHEAGHCVIAAYYGNRGESVSIRQRDDSKGRFVAYLGAFGDPRHDVPRGMILARVSLAGAVAQTIGTRRRWRPWLSSPDAELLSRGLELQHGHDRMELSRIRELNLPDAASLYGEDVDSHLRVVRRLFRRHDVWRTVVRVARGLDRDGEVNLRARADLFEEMRPCWEHCRDDVWVLQREGSR